MAAMAEHEREMISQHTRAALAAAKARGTCLGNPRIENAKVLVITSLKASKFRAGTASLMRNLKGEGRTLQVVADELNIRSVKTARKRQWNPPLLCAG